MTSPVSRERADASPTSPADATAQAAPTAHAAPQFRGRAPWWGPDLQTLRNTLRGGRRAAEALAATSASEARHWLPVEGGDELAAALHRPRRVAPDRPLVVLVHGLGGDESSVYMQRSAAQQLAKGHAVVRLNLRGAGPSRARCREQYHAGRTQDLRAALAGLAPIADEVGADGLALVGFSLGGNAALKLAGEGVDALPLRAVASVSAPIDLAEASRRFLDARNRVYHWHMLRQLKREATAPGAAVTAAEREALLSARSIYEFDDRFVAPRGGFAGADDYYARCSASGFLDAIAVPTLALHALDDPWIPPRPYLEARWRGAARPVLARGGGHVGFHERRGLHPGPSDCWHDRVLTDWFETLFARGR